MKNNSEDDGVFNKMRADELVEVDQMYFRLMRSIPTLNVDNSFIDEFNDNGGPTGLLDGREHFTDVPQRWRNPPENERYPMDEMIELCRDQRLVCPLVQDTRFNN